jgi:hypothetical protein
MDGFMDLHLTKVQLARLNGCRLWLQVTLLSDISTLKGNNITRNAWLGTAPMPSTHDDWSVQSRPHDKVWSLWRRAISDNACTRRATTY